MIQEEKKEVGPRLISALHSLGLDTKAKIKAATGLTDHAIWRYGEGNRAPSLSQLKRLAMAVPALDLYWVITGKKAPQKINGFDMPTLQPNGEYIAGLDWGEAWLEEHKLDIENLAGWIMTESSWLPIIAPGDHVIFNRGVTDINQAGPYVLTMDGGTPIMRNVEPAGHDKYFLCSATPNTISIDVANIKVEGRVVAVLHQKY